MRLFNIISAKKSKPSSQTRRLYLFEQLLDNGSNVTSDGEIGAGSQIGFHKSDYAGSIPALVITQDFATLVCPNHRSIEVAG